MSLPIFDAEVHARAQVDAVELIARRNRHDRAMWALDPRTDSCTRDQEL
jgi:hypothetical protein